MALAIDIKSPCLEEWASMEGGERVRFCQKCKLSVYNLSDMSEAEARKLLAERTGSRLCARILKRWDGTIVTDNCPYKLRRIRNIVRGIAGAAALTLIALMHAESVSAQNLVQLGNSPDQRAIMQLVDYGYDTTREVCRSLTAATFVFSTVLGVIRVIDGQKIAHWMNKNGVCRTKSRKITDQRIRQALIGSILGPLVVHLVGIFIINNTGTTGGMP